MRQNEFNDKLLDIFKVLDNNRKLLYKKYPEEVDYLYISHLLRTASLRFLDYKGKEDLVNKIIYEIKNKIPKYWENIYYKKSSIKFKIICFLAYHKMVLLLKIIKKFGGI